MSRRLLIPMDGSPQSQAALEHALEVHPGAHLTVLHVIDPVEASYSPEATIPGFSENWYETEKERAESLFADAEEQATAGGSEIESVLEVGRPARIIVEYAGEHEIDGIVMGCHGRSGVVRVLLGSVAEAVVRRSPVPVTVVR